MNKPDLFGWALIVMIATVILFIAVSLIFGKPTDFSEGRRKCEAAGGIFYNGGLGADNCEFPPSREKE